MADKKITPKLAPTTADEKLVLKAANFKRLGTKRLNKAVSAISGVTALANPASYSYTPAQVETVLNALKSAVNACESAFTSPKAAARAAITL